MATKLVGLGSNVEVLLGSDAGPKLRELLPERVVVPDEGQVDTDEVSDLWPFCHARIEGRATPLFCNNRVSRKQT